MSNLLLSLRTAGTTLDSFGKALGATQSNLSNAGTEGYARQSVSLSTGSESTAGCGAAVEEQTASTRQEYAEQEVWRQNAAENRQDVVAAGLEDITALLDPAKGSGIVSDLRNFCRDFNAWSATPGDSAAAETVLLQATALANGFSDTADYLRSMQSETSDRIAATVDRINQLTRKLRDLAGQRNPDGFSDAGAETQFFAGLEELSTLIGVRASWAEDGSLRLTAGDGIPLVLGSIQYNVKADAEPVAAGSQNPGGLPHIRVMAGDGVLGSVEGVLGGLLDFRNDTLARLLGDPQQQGELNVLAQRIADEANKSLAPAGPLFAYTGGDPTGVAASFSVDPATAASDLMSVSAATPAAELAALPDSASGIARKVAIDYQSATDARDLHRSLGGQAKAEREQSSGVSVETEMVNLLEFQRSYQAAAKVIGVLNELVDSVLAVVR